ncbi:MAG TPA: putative zinc-binding metallopeptidase [Gemmatimonadaceae bacterium]
MTLSHDDWEQERGALLGRTISELGLSIRGTPLESLVTQLYAELDAKGVAFHPPVYLSDQWGCPEGTPIIGVPFYLADARLARLEQEVAVDLESERDSMRYLRHEAGHAINYAYRLHEREDWRALFGRYELPYRDRFHVDPFSRDHVRHILGFYAQKHPDEDFAETFAVWLTPALDWRRRYAGWGALKKLEWVDRVMRQVGQDAPEVPAPGEDDLPVEAMHWTIGEHYAEFEEPVPIGDPAQFDDELLDVFAARDDAPEGEPAAEFLRRHRREVVRRIAYWTGEQTTTVRGFIDHLVGRAEALELRVSGLEAATLIELTAFGTAVIAHWRSTTALREEDE